MGLRITTWNVNGIRNPFGHQPWKDRKTFEGMFDALEADIVILQETKIQRQHLRDDMVLVPGWDCYWSLPMVKNGCFGVVIYTRNATCAPIRAEEGMTGILKAPNFHGSFQDVPEKENRIGGYPKLGQLTQSDINPVALDVEGRCVILEFPAFVLLGVYCPAYRDSSRNEFRLGFLKVLDSRIRNLVAMGKRVIVAGDFNIAREELDTAAPQESMRKLGLDGQEYVSTADRRIFNQLLVGGKVFGERDKGHEKPIMWDICRGFHEQRKGMFTCWDTRINARPGNFGVRVDYILCSADMKDWFSESNIQEGLMGSDHCPVYVVFKDKVEIDGDKVHIKDIVNPPGMFQGGNRKQEWSSKNLLPTSGKLLAEFNRRRNIQDMFSGNPSSSQRTVVDPGPDPDPDRVARLAYGLPSTSATRDVLDPDRVARLASSTSSTSATRDPDPDPDRLARLAHGLSSTSMVRDFGYPDRHARLAHGTSSTSMTRDSIYPDRVAGLAHGLPSTSMARDSVYPDRVARLAHGLPSTSMTRDSIDSDQVARLTHSTSSTSIIRDFGYLEEAPVMRGILEGRERGMLEGRERGMFEDRERGMLEGRERGMFEDRERGMLEDRGALLQSTASPMQTMGMKRWQSDAARMPAAKRTKPATESTGANRSAKGQQSLEGFFKTNTPTNVEANDREGRALTFTFTPGTADVQGMVDKMENSALSDRTKRPLSTVDEVAGEASRQSWRKLFAKPLVPSCEHGEPCKILLTTKPGVNLGRSFWICNRPLGPSGYKERGTPWRCRTFIWASDWSAMDNE